MNSAEVLAMEVGRELNIMVEDNIFGTYARNLMLPDYSSDISDAFQVVDKMLEDELSLELIVGADGYTMASFLDLGSGFEPRVSRTKYPTLGMPIKGQMVSQSISEAICKAALLCKC